MLMTTQKHQMFEILTRKPHSWADTFCLFVINVDGADKSNFSNILKKLHLSIMDML